MDKMRFSDLDYNAAARLKSDWMLITAGTEGDWNTMTASWGGFGCLWNKDVAFIFIRDTRYTYEFAEKQDRFTLTFFDPKYKDALTYLGRNSGRDGDKVAVAGLTPKAIDGAVTFEEARITMVCKKLYRDEIKEDCFTVDGICASSYPAKDFHRVYVVEIESVYVG